MPSLPVSPWPFCNAAKATSKYNSSRRDHSFSLVYRNDTKFLTLPNLLVGLAAFQALIYLLRFCYRGPSWEKTRVKTLSIVFLIAAAVLVGAPWLLVLALILCAVGDYLLSRDTDQAFLFGIGAFALGHVAYILLFSGHSMAVMGHITSGNRMYIVLGLVIFGIVMAQALWHKAGGLRYAVVGYVPIILLMGITAMGLPALNPLHGALLGAFLFMLSDSVLALEMFLLRKDDAIRKGTPFVVWSTYWAAQFLILIGMGWPS